MIYEAKCDRAFDAQQPTKKAADHVDQQLAVSLKWRITILNTLHIAW